MLFIKSSVLGFLPAVALAANHVVTVGPGGGLTFAPNTVTAAVGDTVQFQFATQNHTATAGNPNAGCKPSGQFNSGFVPAPGAATAATAATPKKTSKLAIRGENSIFVRQTAKLPSFTVQVQDTNPITVYCAQAQHCQAGMVMVINPSATGATSLAKYQALSKQATTNTPAKAVNGGALANLVQGTAANGAVGTAAKGKKAKKAKKTAK